MRLHAKYTVDEHRKFLTAKIVFSVSNVVINPTSCILNNHSHSVTLKGLENMFSLTCL